MCEGAESCSCALPPGPSKAVSHAHIWGCHPPHSSCPRDPPCPFICLSDSPLAQPQPPAWLLGDEGEDPALTLPLWIPLGGSQGSPCLCGLAVLSHTAHEMGPGHPAVWETRVGEQQALPVLSFGGHHPRRLGDKAWSRVTLWHAAWAVTKRPGLCLMPCCPEISLLLNKGPCIFLLHWAPQSL